jgi:hypothetical protein
MKKRDFLDFLINGRKIIVQILIIKNPNILTTNILGNLLAEKEETIRFDENIKRL